MRSETGGQTSNAGSAPASGRIVLLTGMLADMRIRSSFRTEECHFCRGTGESGSHMARMGGRTSETSCSDAGRGGRCLNRRAGGAETEASSSRRGTGKTGWDVSTDGEAPFRGSSEDGA